MAVLFVSCDQQSVRSHRRLVPSEEAGIWVSRAGMIALRSGEVDGYVC